MTDPVSAYFDRFAGRWSDHYGQGGQMAGRIGRFRDTLTRLVPAGAPVLDFGCGSGDITVGLADAWTMTGVDGASAMIARAEVRPQPGGIAWKAVEPGASLPFPDRSFQAVIASSVLEYVPSPKSLLAEFARILTPNGVLAFTVPDPRHSLRISEAKWVRFSRIGWIYALLKRTRWEAQHSYLRISQTRWPYDQWARSLDDLGFTTENPGPCTDPLMMIAARRR